MQVGFQRPTCDDAYKILFSPYGDGDVLDSDRVEDFQGRACAAVHHPDDGDDDDGVHAQHERACGCDVPLHDEHILAQMRGLPLAAKV